MDEATTFLENSKEHFQNDNTTQTKAPKKNLGDFQQTINPEIIQIVANQVWERPFEIVDYELENYSNEKLGFMGLHRFLVITVKQENGLSSQSFFSKIVPPKTDEMADIISNMGVFGREARFYNEIFPLLQKNYQAESWGPICYFISEDVTILENLRTKGYKMYNRILTEPETKSAITSIARMHAASLIAEQESGKTLPELCPKAFNMNMYFDENGFYTKWFKASADTTISLLRHFDLDPTNVLEICEKVRNDGNPSPSKHNVVSHSDLWTNNFMFDESSPPKCLLVDFQLVKYCPMGWDFSMFLYLCTNCEFRDRYKMDMMKHYYGVLEETMRIHGDFKVPEWAEFEESVEEHSLNAAVIAAFYFPSALLDGKSCAEIFGKTEDFRKYMHGNKSDVTLLQMEKDPIYRERMKEALVELAEMARNFKRLEAFS